MQSEKPVFEVRCSFEFRNNQYMKAVWVKGMPSGVILTSWPFSRIKLYKDRLELVPTPSDKIISIKLKDIVSVKNMFFNVAVTLKDSKLPQYLYLQTFSYMFPPILYKKFKEASEKNKLGIKFE